MSEDLILEDEPESDLILEDEPESDLSEDSILGDES